MAGIYIHIPFCKQACHYCDFHFSTNTSYLEQMIQMIGKEAALRKEYLKGHTIETIYFGGGTPSILEPKWIDFLLENLKRIFQLNLKEITLEANPDDLTTEKLQAWKSVGIDRLSLGIQSFDDEILRFYNRAHNSKESIEAIAKARKIGFEKFSMDLIYGFPSQDHQLWEKDLSTALEQDPGHLSCYALSVEPRTALGKWEKTGKFEPASEDFVAEQFEILQAFTETKGYRQYEISNFASSGNEAIHNSNYWKGLSYLGLGPGAHSFDGEKRGANVRNNIQFIRAIEANQIPFEIEEMDELDRLNEYILTSLRTSWGLDISFVSQTFEKDLIQEKRSEISKFQEQGWLVWKDNTLSLSKSGMLLADSIAAALFF
ncbi:MAG TPA: coproporphyrinogen III oxidase [Algoriphagus sp.]|jgi:oxygen-independent coproporphyrinogen-3 oxidase|uniref:radical SAM family heme chaperone HemW n=1 Tax=unclassified Algoriphagus TaxID=2641541 RepID=UPI000C4C1AFC|nr:MULTISPECIES: radical SAM family heme chaperone HemW [unclassified Algoriphagus]MAL12335.1 coproporphyrinogen III oxidase [Algoriphagus sp.]QYH40188.1 radical SAM family heme chaperone HemW [Algoriphagus sp. NBT04N3]HAD49971.1 coproporphyrinogen III oxidase [Algoriphagus sp.]HAH37375.1 coproporphyrinogen III oxidase [Algoriphagus sp.]HAS59345.1 coproporphyrinogen III oxidase [Algoriphagus sp.]|tara:strand:+ start:422 stop:1543 length:1122 start_codon:yes stop_codon:yes gene_type:complete